MKPDEQFLKQPKHFWAYVRTISQNVGYTDRSTQQIKIPTLQQVQAVLQKTGLSTAPIAYEPDRPTSLGQLLLDYFAYRADVLNNYVHSRLMNVTEAKAEFTRLRKQLSPKAPLPMNKQKGKKKAPAYLTGIVNMLIEANAEGLPCDFDPRSLTTVTQDGRLLRTMSRRIDGAFTSAINPIAIWEIKEYYYTTTFGSRVADGIYETLLDGTELEEIKIHHQIHIKHYLIVDDKYTWWSLGRSYLCRIIDILHMGYLDEVLFGYEVVEQIPSIVKDWVQVARRR